MTPPMIGSNVFSAIRVGSGFWGGAAVTCMVLGTGIPRGAFLAGVGTEGGLTPCIGLNGGAAVIAESRAVGLSRQVECRRLEREA